MRDMKYDIARSVAMIWVVGIYHLSEYLFSPLHELQWARMVTWGCLGTFTFISAYFLAGKNEFKNWTQIRVFYAKRLLRLYPLFVLSALTLLLIGFNNWEQTWKGVLGVSTFFAPQINTLWYVSMLIGFYLLTPFLQRGGVVHKLVVYSGIMAGVALFKILIHTGVDNRFFYYFTVYTAGVLFARHTPPPHAGLSICVKGPVNNRSYRLFTLFGMGAVPTECVGDDGRRIYRNFFIVVGLEPIGRLFLHR